MTKIQFVLALISSFVALSATQVFNVYKVLYGVEVLKKYLIIAAMFVLLVGQREAMRALERLMQILVMQLTYYFQKKRKTVISKAKMYDFKSHVGVKKINYYIP